MTKQIIWSQFAESQLNEIFDYYKNKASLTVATKLVRGIINAPIKLIKAPYIGKEEELLKGRTTQYRFIVYKNYKLIYSIDQEQDFMKIDDVFVILPIFCNKRFIS